MLKSALILFRNLLLPTLLAGASLHCLAQDDLDFSVAPPLAPGLADTNANTAPPTTLSDDLLAPQRTFTYDGTGASIFAGALDPTLRVDLLSAESETDTAIRDADQTGQISPYSFAGSRAATAFSRTGSSPGSRNGAPSDSSSASTSSASNTGYQPSYGASSEGSGVGAPSGGSTWGASSASSWGGRPSANSGSRQESSSAPEAVSPLGGESPSDSSLSTAQTSQAANNLSNSQPSLTTGWRSTGLTVSRPTSIGIPSTPLRNPTTFGAGSTDRFIAHPGKPLDVSGNPPNYVGPQVVSGVPQQQQPADRGLAFLPGTEAATQASSSPFRSLDSADFLQPDILATTKLSLAPKRSDRSATEDRSRYLRQSGNNQNALDTTASDYGLKPAAKSSQSRSKRGKSAKHTNPYLARETSPSSQFDSSK